MLTRRRSFLPYSLGGAAIAVTLADSGRGLPWEKQRESLTIKIPCSTCLCSRMHRRRQTKALPQRGGFLVL